MHSETLSQTKRNEKQIPSPTEHYTPLAQTVFTVNMILSVPAAAQWGSHSLLVHSTWIQTDILHLIFFQCQELTQAAGSLAHSVPCCPLTAPPRCSIRVPLLSLSSDLSSHTITGIFLVKLSPHLCSLPVY